MLGVIDRIEEDLAVILIEEEKRELVIPKDELPEHATTGTWLQITTIKADTYEFVINETKTNEQKTRVQHLREQLLARSKRNKS